MAMDGGANRVVVGVWRTNRVVVDLDGREGDVLKFWVGTDFGAVASTNSRLRGVFGCTKGLDLKVSPIQTPSSVTAFLAEGTMWTPNRVIINIIDSCWGEVDWLRVYLANHSPLLGGWAQLSLIPHRLGVDP